MIAPTRRTKNNAQELTSTNELLDLIATISGKILTSTSTTNMSASSSNELGGRATTLGDETPQPALVKKKKKKKEEPKKPHIVVEYKGEINEDRVEQTASKMDLLIVFIIFIHRSSSTSSTST